MTRARSAELFEKANTHLVGGVNSPVRAFKGVGGDPIFFAEAKPSKPLQHPEIAQRVNVARDAQGPGALTRPLGRFVGKKRTLRVNFVEELQDCERLRECSIIRDERGDERGRVELTVRRLPMLTRPQVDGGTLVREPFQLEPDSNAIRRGGAPVVVQPHAVSRFSMTRTRCSIAPKFSSASTGVLRHWNFLHDPRLPANGPADGPRGAGQRLFERACRSRDRRGLGIGTRQRRPHAGPCRL